MASTMSRYGETSPPQSVQLLPGAKLGTTWKKGATFFFETTTSRLRYYLEFIPRFWSTNTLSVLSCLIQLDTLQLPVTGTPDKRVHKGAFTRDAPLRRQATSSLSFSTSFIT
jgi:hypothetical protein